MRLWRSPRTLDPIACRVQREASEANRLFAGLAPCGTEHRAFAIGLLVSGSGAAAVAALALVGSARHLVRAPVVQGAPPAVGLLGLWLA